MQVQIEIESKDVLATVEETLRALSPERKGELAERVLVAWLKDVDAERVAINTRIAQADIWQRDELRTHTTVREKLLESLRLETAQAFKVRVERLAAEDATLQAEYEKIRADLCAQFPAMVQAAMVQWFASRFTELGAIMATVYTAQQQTATSLAEVRMKLGLPPQPPQGG